MKNFYCLTFMVSLSIALVSKAQEHPTSDLNSETQIRKSLDVRYYYYPNLQAYFDTETSFYFFYKNGNWLKEQQIPSGYRGYSMLNKRKVAIADYNGESPYLLINEHKKLFPANYSAKRQPAQKNQQNIQIKMVSK